MCSRLISCCLVLALLSGCAGVGGLKLPGVGASTTTADEQRALPEQLVVTPNPYLSNQRPVSEEASRRFAGAKAAMAEEDWDRAEADLNWLMAEYPKLSGPYLNMALLHQARGDAEQAERYFQTTLEVNETNLDAYNQYAIFLRQQGRFDDAEAAYLAALDVWKDHPATHRNLGVLYDLYRGDREKALQHYHRYQSLTDGEDRAVAGWIIDLERRFGQVVQVAPR